MVELEFAIVEFMICSLRGGTPRVHPLMGYTPHERWIVFKTKELRKKHFVSS